MVSAFLLPSLEVSVVIYKYVKIYKHVKNTQGHTIMTSGSSSMPALTLQTRCRPPRPLCQAPLVPRVLFPLPSQDQPWCAVKKIQRRNVYIVKCALLMTRCKIAPLFCASRRAYHTSPTWMCTRCCGSARCSHFLQTR